MGYQSRSLALVETWVAKTDTITSHKAGEQNYAWEGKKDCVIDDCLFHKLVAVSFLSRIISLHYHFLCFAVFFSLPCREKVVLRWGQKEIKGKKEKEGIT